MDVSRHASLAAILIAPLAAQTVHVVGPGGFAQISPAIAAASPGDVIRVAAGTYREFACDKGVTIAADPGAQVDIVAGISFLPSVALFQLPGGQSARVRGLDFRSPQVFQVLTTHVIDSVVAFESCTFAGELTIQEVMLARDSSVSLRDCDLIVHTTAVDNPALRAEQSRIVAVDCSFRGSDLTPDGSAGAGDGIRATNSHLHLVRCLVRGGDTPTVFCFYPPGDGVVTDRGDRTWIADSTLVGGTSACGPGGAALVNTSASPARLARTTLQPGVGTTPGPIAVGPTVADDLIGLAAPSQALTRGVAYRVDYRTDPNELLIVFASCELWPRSPSATVETTWMPPAPLLWVTTRRADVTGLAVWQATVPNVPGLRDVGVWFHAVDFASAPWHVGPPVGGIVR